MPRTERPDDAVPILPADRVSLAALFTDRKKRIFCDLRVKYAHGVHGIDRSVARPWHIIIQPGHQAYGFFRQKTYLIRQTVGRNITGGNACSTVENFVVRKKNGTYG